MIIPFSILLHIVKGLVGVGDHLFQLNPRPVDRYTDAALDRNALSARLNAALEAEHKPVQHAAQLLFVVQSGQQDDKLIAPIPSHHTVILFLVFPENVAQTF